MDLDESEQVKLKQRSWRKPISLCMKTFSFLVCSKSIIKNVQFAWYFNCMKSESSSSFICRRTRNETTFSHFHYVCAVSDVCVCSCIPARDNTKALKGMLSYHVHEVEEFSM